MHMCTLLSQPASTSSVSAISSIWLSPPDNSSHPTSASYLPLLSFSGQLVRLYPNSDFRTPLPYCYTATVKPNMSLKRSSKLQSQNIRGLARPSCVALKSLMLSLLEPGRAMSSCPQYSRVRLTLVLFQMTHRYMGYSDFFCVAEKLTSGSHTSRYTGFPSISPPRRCTSGSSPPRAPPLYPPLPRSLLPFF